jgi:hypothetical protein
MKLTKLIRLTPRKIAANAEDCKIYKAKVGTSKKTGATRVRALVYRIQDSGKKSPKHKVEISGKAPGKLATVDVLVQCDCGLQVYHGAEWVLAQKGAARIIYGNGDPPDQTNPAYRPYICHHLIKLANSIIRKDI